MFSLISLGLKSGDQQEFQQKKLDRLLTLFLLMRCGLKNLLLLSLFTFISFQALAELDSTEEGWNPLAWPSTNHIKSGLVFSTNVWARYNIEYSIVTGQVLSLTYPDTNYSFIVPGWLNSTSDYLYGYHHLPTNDYQYSYLNKSRWFAIGVPKSVISNAFIVTNFYLTSIGPLEVTGTSSNNSLSSYFVDHSFGTNVASLRVYERIITLSYPIQTNLSFRVQDLRAFDCYRAFRQIQRIYNHGSSADIKFYISERDNLLQFKSLISDEVGFLGLIKRESLVEEFDLNDPFPRYTSGISLVSDVGAPTNYLSWTPYIQLSGGPGELRVSTNVFTISTTNTTIVTNSVVDTVGNSHVIIGTNGQQFSFIVTNFNIQAGFTSVDYGWKRLPSIVTKFFVSGVGPFINLYNGAVDWVWDSPSGWIAYSNANPIDASTWAGALAAINWQGDSVFPRPYYARGPTAGSLGSYSAFGGVTNYNIYADVVRARIRLTWLYDNFYGTSTNYSLSMWHYVCPFKYNYPFSFSGTYDRGADTNLAATENRFKVYHKYTIAKNWNQVWTGGVYGVQGTAAPDLPPICDEPTSVSSLKTKGNLISYHDGISANYMRHGLIYFWRSNFTNVIQ